MDLELYYSDIDTSSSSTALQLTLSRRIGGIQEKLGLINGHDVQGEVHLDPQSFEQVLMGLLPIDAWACLLLTNESLYDGTCLVNGLAYWHARFAVVSLFVRNPFRDLGQTSEADTHEYTWPLIHLKMRENLHVSKGNHEDLDSNEMDGLQEAYGAIERGHSPPINAIGTCYFDEKRTVEIYLTDRWLYRVIGTSAHEVLHLFGIEHCNHNRDCVLRPGNAH